MTKLKRIKTFFCRNKEEKKIESPKIEMKKTINKEVHSFALGERKEEK